MENLFFVERIFPTATGTQRGEVDEIPLPFARYLDLLGGEKGVHDHGSAVILLKEYRMRANFPINNLAVKLIQYHAKTFQNHPWRHALDLTTWARLASAAVVPRHLKSRYAK
ncbi:MAG: hypothetical protein ABIT76_05595 [Chthoniobacterales bacterium]